MKDHIAEVYRDRPVPDGVPAEASLCFLSKITKHVETLERHDESDDFMVADMFGAIDDFRTAIGLNTLDECDDASAEDKSGPSLESFPVTDACRLLSKMTKYTGWLRTNVHDETDAFVYQRIVSAIDDYRVALGLPTLDEQDDLDGVND